MAAGIEKIKADFLMEIKSNRKSWNYTAIPQIIFIFLIGLTFLTGFGLYISITSIKNGISTNSFTESLKFYVTGSSSLLGVIVFKIMTRLSEVSKSYLNELKQFSATINIVKAVNSNEELINLMRDYYKR